MIVLFVKQQRMWRSFQIHSLMLGYQSPFPSGKSRPWRNAISDTSSKFHAKIGKGMTLLMKTWAWCRFKRPSEDHQASPTKLDTSATRHARCQLFWVKMWMSGKHTLWDIFISVSSIGRGRDLWRQVILWYLQPRCPLDHTPGKGALP